MWVPSHLGIKGNELADRAANQATSSGSDVNIGLSPSEIRSKIKHHFVQKRTSFLKNRCRRHGWLFESNMEYHIPSSFPRYNQQVLNRVKTISSRCFYVNFHCPCGAPVSLKHVIHDCPSLPQLDAVREFRRINELKVDDFLRPHGSLGVRPMRLLSDALVRPDLRRWF